MKTLKMASIFSARVLIVCCFTIVSFGFNPPSESLAGSPQVQPGSEKRFDPQPEPPGRPIAINPPSFDPDPDPSGTPKMMEPISQPAQIGGSIVSPGSEAMEEEIPVQPKSKRMIHPPEKTVTQPINK